MTVGVSGMDVGDFYRGVQISSRFGGQLDERFEAGFVFTDFAVGTVRSVADIGV